MNEEFAAHPAAEACGTAEEIRFDARAARAPAWYDWGAPAGALLTSAAVAALCVWMLLEPGVLTRGRWGAGCLGPVGGGVFCLFGAPPPAAHHRGAADRDGAGGFLQSVDQTPPGAGDCVHHELFQFHQPLPRCRHGDGLCNNFLQLRLPAGQGRQGCAGPILRAEQAVHAVEPQACQLCPEQTVPPAESVSRPVVCI